MFVDYVKNTAHDHPELIGILGFLLGLLVGHNFALGRDRRKERNEYADQLEFEIRRQLGSSVCSRLKNDNGCIENIARRMWVWERNRLRDDVLKYSKAVADIPRTIQDGGIVVYGDDSPARRVLKDILSYIHIR